MALQMGVNTQNLQTEGRNPNTMEMDTLSVEELAQVLHNENFLVAEAVQQALPQIAKAIEIITDRLQQGGRLFYIGAGTSGRIGVLDASECPPTFGVGPELIQGIIAGGDTALRNSIEGAEDDPEQGVKDLRERNLSSGDVVVGIAASGRTPYVIGALNAARDCGAPAIAVVNVSPSEMERSADITIAAVTGPEALTGSTRLKAGTAQKLVLNLISTGVMVRLGKTYGNLMVNVRASNEKLKDRAIRIVIAATGTERSQAAQALEGTDWHAKSAIVQLKLGVSPEEAASRLGKAQGYVRRAIEE